MKKSDLIQTCSHIFNVSPLKKILAEKFPSKKAIEEIKELGIETIYNYLNKNMSEIEITKMIIGSFNNFSQEIHVFRLIDHKAAIDNTKLIQLLSKETTKSKIEEINNISDVVIHAEVGKIFFQYKLTCKGFKMQDGTGGTSGSMTDFDYYVPVIIEFLSPYFLKIRISKFTLRTGIKPHFNGITRLLLQTDIKFDQLIEDITFALVQSPFKMEFAQADLLNSVVKSADLKKISTVVISWDEKDNIHQTRRGRRDMTLHGYNYIQKILKVDSMGVGEGRWYFTDPTLSIIQQDVKKLPAIKVIPSQGFISYDSFRLTEIEDQVNEFIKLA